MTFRKMALAEERGPGVLDDVIFIRQEIFFHNAFNYIVFFSRQDYKDALISNYYVSAGALDTILYSSVNSTFLCTIFSSLVQTVM